jgi:hypothetical protein
MTFANDGRYAETLAQRDWERARQAATLEDVRSVLPFMRHSSDLLSFDEVQRKLHLAHKNYLGIHEVELVHIRGSVGRYKDFTGTFLPRSEQMRTRWIKVSAVGTSHGHKPVELYKVGEAYFVIDGNHRVSVARQAGSASIQAHVWEFKTPVGLSADADIDELLIKEEYTNFLERTRLDELRPGATIEFTTPGRYREIEYQIGMYQHVLEKIDEVPTSYEDAVTAWYDMIYTPACQIIRERGILERFSKRTEADLFIWVWQHGQELKERGIESLAVAADEISEQNSIWRKMFNFLKQLFTRDA